MAVNADKPHIWKQDVAASVDLYNDWFMRSAPEAFKTTRARTAEQVRMAMSWTQDLSDIRPELLISHPDVLPILRMATAPPIARDRLIGLAKISPNLIISMEKRNCVPQRMGGALLSSQLTQAASVLRELLDTDILTWLESNSQASDPARQRAATIIADRLCGTVADPIIRNAQEQRQLALIAEYLEARGYKRMPLGERVPFDRMPDMTFSFRVNVPVQIDDQKRVNIPIDAVVQPARANTRASRFPLLLEAKSAGDFTNTNKRRKEEAIKITQLKKTYGQEIDLILLLCGYFDSGYLGYEAAEGIDWVWEHRIDDLGQFGV